MPNPLFNKFGNQNQYGSNKNNIFTQLAYIKNNPGYILDILLQNGKINQKQYNELQPYKNNPEAIGKYLMNSGDGNELRQIERAMNHTL